MKILYLCVFFLMKGVFATVISDERGRVLVDLPSDWSHEKKIMGLPHLFLSNEVPIRSSLSVTLTGIKGVNLVVKDLKSHQKKYQDGRQKWAAKRNIKILGFLPYEVQKNKSGISTHQIGLTYQLKDHIYLEKSFYVECPDTFVHLKLLGLKSSSKMVDAERSVKELVCHTDKK